MPNRSVSNAAAIAAFFLVATTGASSSTMTDPARMVMDINVAAPSGELALPGTLTATDNFLFFTAGGFWAQAAKSAPVWRSDGTQQGTELLTDVPEGFSAVLGSGDALYFLGGHALYGLELWRSDGTATGTELVRDLWPGVYDFSEVGHRVCGFRSEPRLFHQTSQGVYFVASQGTLWWTDGTHAGTGPVESAPSIYENTLTKAGDRLFYIGNSEAAGYELHVVEGGRVSLVSDIIPGPGSSSSTRTNDTGGGNCDRSTAHNEGPLAYADRHVFFIASDTTQYGIWKSDGTAEGTTLVKAGLGRDLTAAGGLVFFWMDDEVNGRELWRTDGTSDGTILLRDIRPGAEGSIPRWLTAVGNQLLFLADDGVHGLELWASDGTPEGTRLVVDHDPEPSGYGYPGGLLFQEVGGQLWFHRDGRLWRSDGTEAGTVEMLPAGTGLTTFGMPVSLAGYFYVPACGETEPCGVWRYDGDAWTFAIGITKRDPGEAPSDFTMSGEATYFTASSPGSGRELWMTDGTAAGTELLDVRPGDSSSNPKSLIDCLGNLYFMAAGADGTPALQRTDGDVLETVLTFDTYGYKSVPACTAKRLYFNFGHWSPPSGPAWTDGTDIRSSGFRFFYEGFVVSGDTAYFAGELPGEPWSLWAYVDASDEPSKLSTFSYPTQLTNVGGTLYFETGVNRDIDLWRAEGGVTSRVFRWPGWGTGIGQLTGVGARLFFSADDGDGHELWVSDGTGDGTRKVKDLEEGPVGANPRLLSGLGESVLFVASSPEKGFGLWASDGSEAGTKMIHAGHFREAFEVPEANGALLAGAVPGFGSELWFTNGTAEGTCILQDLWPGASSSNANGFGRSGSHIYFSANDGVHGFEPWILDVGDLAVACEEPLQVAGRAGRTGAFGWFSAAMFLVLGLRARLSRSRETG